jgi:sterol desaturase/sphingolipid hydroxylase (fatty acid hydroxylase superfamily)
MDMSGSQVFHPLEMLVFALMGVAVTTLVLGLDPLAAAVTGYIAAFYGMFQHLNLKTPQWLGVIIQRPEAHCVHHSRGVHAWNYADFPLWDMIFGSWRNPKHFEGEVGFDAPANRRLGAMLAFADVNAPIIGRGSLGRVKR